MNKARVVYGNFRDIMKIEGDKRSQLIRKNGDLDFVFSSNLSFDSTDQQ